MTRPRKNSTRDIAVETRALTLAHIDECKKDREARGKQRTEDIERQNDQHAANQTLLAAQMEEARRWREDISRRLEDLKNAVAVGDKVVDGKVDKETDARKEMWSDIYRWGAYAAGTALVAALWWIITHGKP